EFLLEGREVDPVIEAASFQRVVNFPRAVRRQDDDRDVLGANGAELGNGDLEVGQELEQEGFELLVGPVNLVDQENRRLVVGSINRLQERTLQQEIFRKDILAGFFGVNLP